MSWAIETPAINNGVLWSLQPAVFFGLYSASFIHCVRWLLFEDEGWKIRKKLNWILVTTTLLVFFLSTALFCAVPMQVIFNEPSARDIKNPSIVGIAAYYLTLATIDSSAIQWSILMVIDSVMIYRCWIVFSKNWFAICFPIVLWCFCLICAIISFCCDLATPGLFDVIVSDFTVRVCLQPGLMDIMPPLAFYVCNIVINVYTTSALVYKIWRTVKNNLGRNRLYKICRILAESGILYTFSSLIYLISWIQLFFIYSNEDVVWESLFIDPAAALTLLPVGFQIVLGLGMFIPGIAFNLVIIRIGEQRVTGEDNWVDSKEDSEVPTPPELHNRPDISTQLEAESTELSQERHERMDEREVMAIDGMGAGEITEVYRTSELERQC